MKKAIYKKEKPVSPIAIVIYILLSLLVIVYVAPLLWMINVSLKTNAEVFADPFALPEVLQLGNYIFSWTKGSLGKAMMNSVIVCGSSLLLSLIIGLMASFAIARMKWKLSNVAMTYFMIGMMVPVHCVLIPLFVRFSGWPA